MDFSQARYADVTVAAVSGRIDHANAEAFKAQLWPVLGRAAGAGDALLIDLSGLEYISSAGLRVLMLAGREMQARQGRLALCALQPLVREIFEISRFDVVFRLLGDLPAALAELSPRAAAARAGG